MRILLPSNGQFGVEIHDLNPAQLSPDQADEIQQLVYEHKLVVFVGTELSNTAYIEFASRFGEPQTYFQPNYHHPDHPEIFVSSNVPEQGKKVGVAGTGRYWHSDYQFFDDPLPMTMVMPKQVGSGGERKTFYIDMERVWQDMPDDLRAAVKDRRAVHEGKMRYKIQATDIDRSIAEILHEVQTMVPPVTHPMIINHPVNGRELLYVSEGFTVGVEGLCYEDSEDLLQRLLDYVEREEHVHARPWRIGDLLFWDNRQVIHKASAIPKGQPSVSYRIGVYDGLPFYTQSKGGLVSRGR